MVSVFWDFAPSSVLEIVQRFGSTYCPYHQGDEWSSQKTISHARSHKHQKSHQKYA